MTSKRRRHNPEQIIRKLQDAEKLQAQGHDVAAIARELGVTEATYYRWKNQYGGLKAEDAKRLKELEKQNDRLKRLLADAELEKAALKELVFLLVICRSNLLPRADVKLFWRASSLDASSRGFSYYPAVTALQG